MDTVKAFEIPADIRKFAKDAGDGIRLQAAFAKVPANEQPKKLARAAAKFGEDTVSAKPL